MATVIGYLLHHHFRETEGQAVIFYDESITDTGTPMGGSGKGLIVNAIKQLRVVSKVDGKHLDNNSCFKFEQIKTSTQVVWIDDVSPGFDIGILNSNLTDGWTVERKFRPKFHIPCKDSPKTVICSNSIIKGGGTTNKRRQFIIELSDFYSKQIKTGDEKPIEQTHGCLFFNDVGWNKKEWNIFYSVMLDCAQQYLIKGLVHHSGINVELNRLRQETCEDFVIWIQLENLKTGTRYETQKYFTHFVNTCYAGKHQIEQKKFSEFIKKYSIFKGWTYECKPSNGIAYFYLHEKSS